MSIATTQGPVIDRIIDQPWARSRSGSANPVPLNGSLSPPPRRRKPQSPATFPASSATSLPVQRPPMSASVIEIMEGPDASPFSDPSLPESLGSPSALSDEGSQGAHNYANSFSSLNSYSNLFYNPEDEARSSPIIPPVDNPTMDHTNSNFDDAASTEDYSDLLYPELQSPVGLLSVHDLYGPPMRKRLASFASQASLEGPESPVEFANIGALSLPSPIPVLEEHRPSKVDRLLGIDSRPSSRQGSTDMLLIDQARRDSFIEFDTQPSRASPGPNTETALRTQSSMSDEMPVFAPRHRWSVMASQPSGSIEGCKALVDAVNNNASPKLDSRQVLVDGSDKRQWPKLSNHDKTGSSAGHPRLSTTNLLDKKERAEGVRKNRKILQVLGPGVVPSAQAFARTGATATDPDTPGLRHDPLHRPTRSHSLGGEEARSEALYKTRVKELLIPRRSPNLQAKSSWTALEQDTIFLNASGRRHSSPLNLTFDSSSVSRQFDSDTASLSSLGSIIVGLERIGDQEDTRSRSSASFMEMSDDEGAKTPKRRPSVESREPEVQSRQRTGRAASLNDILTISGALEAPSPVGTPDTPVTDYSLSIASRNRSRPTSDMTFQSSLYSGSNDYDLDDIKGDEAGLERQRKREKLAKIHRYLGSKVPPELVLGHSSSSNPPSAFPRAAYPGVVPDSRIQEVKKRRRSLSPVMYQHNHGVDPLKQSEAQNRAQDTFTDVERMTRIRRAQKLEQIFGEPPSRPLSMSVPLRPSSAQGSPRNQSIAPTTPSKRSTVALPTPEHPQTERGFKPPSPFVWKGSRRPSTSGSSRPSTAQSTTGLMSSHQKTVERDKKPRGKHHQTHSARITSTSLRFPIGTALGSPEDLHGNEVLDISANAMASYGSKSPVILGVPTSRQFLDYRNSLNSLGRILDHDDRQSLNDLHAVLDSDEEEDDPDQQTSAPPSGSIDTQKTIQPRASIVSINSVATTSTFATLTPDPTAFQARRKRAAKLIHFFGASYRDLFGEVLIRIERGMLEEARAGQISEEEIKHLMKQLDLLKRRQSQLS